MNKERVKMIKFALVGFFNTVIDFIVLNIAQFTFGLPLIAANYVSATVAVVISFVANKKIVFQNQDEGHVKQAFKFVGITLFGLYVIQAAVIAFVTEVWLWPVDTFISFINSTPLEGLATDEFLTSNGAKLLATATTLVWNYVGYNYFVFEDHKKNEEV